MNKSTCLNLVKQTIDNFNVKFPKFSIKHPEVGFFSSGTAAGLAYRAENKIEFNEIIMSGQNEETFIQTIIHEICHKIVHAYFPRAKQQHGREWKYFMQIMGAEVKRCHSYDTSNCKKNKMKYFLYSCVCGEKHQVSARSHNSLQSSPNYVLRCIKSRYIITQKDFTHQYITK